MHQILSFFETLESPAVEAYKLAQEAALKSVISKKTTEEEAPAPQDAPVRRNRASTLAPIASVRSLNRVERRRSSMKDLGNEMSRLMKLDSVVAEEYADDDDESDSGALF